MTRRRRLVGFSLVELLITTSILSGIGLVLMTTSLGGLETFAIVRTKQNAFSSFLEMYTRIDNFVRVAVEFPTTHTGTNGVTYTAGPTTLIMKLKGLSRIGTAECQGYDVVVYYLNANTLHERLEAASDSARGSYDRVVFENLSTLSFTQAKPAGLHRSVTVDSSFVERSVPQRSVMQTHSQTMVARND